MIKKEKLTAEISPKTIGTVCARDYSRDPPQVSSCLALPFSLTSLEDVAQNPNQTTALVFLNGYDESLFSSYPFFFGPPDNSWLRDQEEKLKSKWIVTDQ